jgi:hypothetical protein
MKMERTNKRLKRFMSISQALLLEELPDVFGMNGGVEERKGYMARERKRRSINDIFQEQGPYYVRRAYRMTAASFWTLHKMLKADIGDPAERKAGSMKTHKNGARNGLISYFYPSQCCTTLLCWWTSR